MYVWHTQRERTDDYFLMESYAYRACRTSYVTKKREENINCYNKNKKKFLYFLNLYDRVCIVPRNTYFDIVSEYITNLRLNNNTTLALELIEL